MTKYPDRPEFATNRLPEGEDFGETVAGALNSLLEAPLAQWKTPPHISIATAYFNPGGFSLLEKVLSEVSGTRLLLGAEPDPTASRLTVRPLGAGRGRAAKKQDAKAAVDRVDSELEIDRNLLGFTREADAQARRLVAWLRSGKVQVKRYNRGFLHGKAFLVADNNAGHGVLAGSSNFTYAGLARNNELNLGQYQPSTVDLVSKWYERQWADSEEYDLAGLYEERWIPHRPWDIFLRMLLEIYGPVVEEEDKKTALGLTNFQADGVWRAARILARRKGVLIADEVGLGKTFTAGELIYQALRERRQKVLIIAPATLRDNTWNPFLASKNIQTDVLSFEELTRDIDRAGQAGVTLQAIDEYAMVVVDEAHNLRSPVAQRAEAMRKLLGGPVPKDLVLLTATPVNNSLMDLYQLISYFSRDDATFSDVGIASLSGYFKAAQDRDPEDLAPEHLFDVLDAVAVRRTRKFVKRYYLNDQVEFNGVKTTIQFPTARVKRVDYDLGAELPGFFDELAVAIGGEGDELDSEGGVILSSLGDTLTMARYVPSRFLLKGATEQFQMQNAGLLRSNLLKRFESSATAFGITVGRMIASHEAFLGALDTGWVLTGDALRDWVATDSDEASELAEDAVRTDRLPASEFDVPGLTEAVQADRDLLARLRDRVVGLDAATDPKILALLDELREIARDAKQQGVGEQDTIDKRKTLIFTYFADTAFYVHDALVKAINSDESLADFRGRLAIVTGRDSGNKDSVITGFAPRTAGTKDSPDLYDLVVTTDVLAEGVNLQQARNIINYDLPWNPMRLVQRHGRIDRIGSSHSEIFLHCFFPDQDLDALLGLEERLQRKLRQAAAAVGVGEVLPGMTAVDRDFTQTRDEILKLRREDATLFDDQGAAVSGEEYRRQLATALANPDATKVLNSLPWGAGSGFAMSAGSPGFVFCARVADSPEAILRYVPLTPELGVVYDGEGRPEIYTERGTCLAQAEPRDADTPAHLPESYVDAAFDAWAVAKDHILAEWTHNTDPKNLSAPVPAVMRRAADLVRRHGFHLGAEQDELEVRLNAAVAPRIQKEIRGVMGQSGLDDRQRIDLLQRRVAELGLQRPAAPKPNEPIEADDIYLICWMANVA